MKPITEDQVKSLMKGLESREKNALKRLAQSAERPDANVSKTVRILSYTSPDTKNRTHRENDANQVQREKVRAAQGARSNS